MEVSLFRLVLLINSPNIYKKIIRHHKRVNKHIKKEEKKKKKVQYILSLKDEAPKIK